MKDLNVKFNEIEGEVGGSVEGDDRVLLEGYHPVIGGLQDVHAVPSVSYH